MQLSNDVDELSIVPELYTCKYVALMLTRKTATKSESEAAPRQCLICGGPTRYAHMEIDACRACAVFYRRLMVREKPLVCRTGKLDCDTKIGGTLCCKRCRFDRFTDVLNDSRKPRNDQKIEDHADEPSTSTAHFTQFEHATVRLKSASQSSVLENVRRGHSLMNTIRRTSELSTRENIIDEQAIFVDGMMVIPTTYTLLNQTTRILISSIFEFASTAFEEFKTLSHDEQVLYFLEVFSSYATYLDHNTIPRFVSDSPNKTNRDDGIRFLKNHLDGDVRHMHARMRRWGPTEDEYLAFIGICFWSLDKISVSDKVHVIADKYRELLFIELDGVYRKMRLKEYASRMGEAVLFVETIQSAFFEMRSKLGMLKLLDIIGEEMMIAQLHL